MTKMLWISGLLAASAVAQAADLPATECTLDPIEFNHTITSDMLKSTGVMEEPIQIDCRNMVRCRLASDHEDFPEDMSNEAEFGLVWRSELTDPNNIDQMSIRDSFKLRSAAGSQIGYTISRQSFMYGTVDINVVDPSSGMQYTRPESCEFDYTFSVRSRAGLQPRNAATYTHDFDGWIILSRFIARRGDFPDRTLVSATFSLTVEPSCSISMASRLNLGELSVMGEGSGMVNISAECDGLPFTLSVEDDDNDGQGRLFWQTAEQNCPLIINRMQNDHIPYEWELLGGGLDMNRTLTINAGPVLSGRPRPGCYADEVVITMEVDG